MTADTRPAPRPVEIAAVRVARTGVLQQMLCIERLAAGIEMDVQKAVARVGVVRVVNRLADADLDARRGDQVHDRRENVEVDEQVLVDLDAEILLDGFRRQRGTAAARITVGVAQ